MAPNFGFEKKFWEKHYEFVAGVDEVGRGCFAGPVVAGAVVFSRGSKIFKDVRIDDSKKMTSRQREKADRWLKENALAWGIGEAKVSQINRLGMGRATKIAFRRAISDARRRLGSPIDFLLADAFFVPYVPGLPARRRKNKKGRYYKKANGRQLAIVNGDEKSVSIAAASIIAKVYRDKLMTGLSKKPNLKSYGWGKNKGYGTKEHQNAIKRHGVSRYHRRQFVETWLAKSQ